MDGEKTQENVILTSKKCKVSDDLRHIPKAESNRALKGFQQYNRLAQ